MKQYINITREQYRETILHYLPPDTKKNLQYTKSICGDHMKISIENSHWFHKYFSRGAVFYGYRYLLCDFCEDETGTYVNLRFRFRSLELLYMLVGTATALGGVKLFFESIIGVLFLGGVLLLQWLLFCRIPLFRRHIEQDLLTSVCKAFIEQ